MLFSILTYFIPLFLYGSFDFGLIFEIVCIVFIWIAHSQVKQGKVQNGKRNVIIAMVPIGWLIIYDLINLIVNIQEVAQEVWRYYTSIDQYLYYLEPYLYDVILVAVIVLLYKANASLNKAQTNSNEQSNFVEDFYDKL